MNTASRTISGALCLLFGFMLGYNSFKSEAFWVLFVYGAILIFLGIFIILNKNEDKIEQIKTIPLKTEVSSKKKGKRK
jgi:uncharacterized membrane protein HdeD (DUF308 family)